MTTRSRGDQNTAPEDRQEEEAASATRNRRTLDKLSRRRRLGEPSSSGSPQPQEGPTVTHGGEDTRTLQTDTCG